MVADPFRSFGSPIFERGGARVDDVLHRFWAGDSLEELAAEYRVPAEQLEGVLRVASRRAALSSSSTGVSAASKSQHSYATPDCDSQRCQSTTAYLLTKESLIQKMARTCRPDGLGRVYERHAHPL